MIVEKAKITGKQYMFSVACFIVASALLSSHSSGITLQETWIVVVIGFICAVPLLSLHTCLIKMFPEKTLAQMNDAAFGKPIGRVVSAVYLLYFITIGSMNLCDITSLVKQTILFETPVILPAMMIAILSIWAVRSGVKTVTRYGSLFFIMAGTVITAAVAIISKDLNIGNFLPVFDLPFKNYVQGVNIFLTIPTGEIVSFLVIVPNIENAGKDGGKYLLTALAASTVLMLLIVYSDIAVLGNTLGFFANPTFETLRMITLSPSIGHMEVLFVLVMLMLMFFKVTFLLYVSVLMTAQILGFDTYRPFAAIIGVLVAVYSLFVMPGVVKEGEMMERQLPILWLFFEYVLPGAALLAAKIKLGAAKKKKPRESGAAA